MRDRIDELWRVLRQRQRPAGEVLEEVELLLSRLPAGDSSSLELRRLRAGCWRATQNLLQAASELEQLARDADTGNTELATEARLELASILFHRGELARSNALAGACLEAARAQGNLALQGDAVYQLSLPNAMQDKLAEALPLAQEALRLHSISGDERRMAISRSIVAMLLVKQGNNLEGVQLWRQSLQYYEQEGDEAGEAMELMRIGFATWCQGDLEQTRRTLQRVLAIHAGRPQLVAPHHLMVVYFNLANVEMRAGNLDKASERFDEAARLAHQLGDMAILANVHIGSAHLELLRLRPAAALVQRGLAQETAKLVDLPFKDFDLMLFALVDAACGDLEAARSNWPGVRYRQPDSEQCVMLDGLARLARQLGAASETRSREQFSAWAAELEDACKRGREPGRP